VIIGRIGAKESSELVEAEPLRQGRSLIIIGLLHVAFRAVMVIDQGVLLHPLKVLLERAVVHESVLPLWDKLPFKLLGELHHGGVRLRRRRRQRQRQSSNKLGDSSDLSSYFW
jgi:hypothetical protein